jgi:hypothetical protein
VTVASLNWYPHYWLAVVPFAAVGTALAFVPADRRWHARVMPRLVVAATVVVAVLGVVVRVPVDLEQPAVARFVAAAAAPGDTMTVMFGRANLVEDSGLRTPYPYSWVLPVRVEDPHLTLFRRLLVGGAAPTWLVTATHPKVRQPRPPALAGLLARRYHLAAVVCGDRILLRDGVDRSLGAGDLAASRGRC